MAAYKDHIANARHELQTALRAISSELQSYPTPVAGCDLQYTHLLAEHRKVSAAIGALGTAPFIPTPRTLFPESGVESR